MRVEAAGCYASTHMSDRFRPISMEQLTTWVFTELEAKDSLFGIPRTAFFTPGPNDRFRLHQCGQPLESPFGVAGQPLLVEPPFEVGRLCTQMATRAVTSTSLREIYQGGENSLGVFLLAG